MSPPAIPLFCDQCASALPEGARFCGICGAPAPRQPVSGSGALTVPIWDLALASAAIVAVLASIFLPWQAQEVGLSLTAGRASLAIALSLVGFLIIQWRDPGKALASLSVQAVGAVTWLVVGLDLLLRADAEIGVFLLLGAAGVLVLLRTAVFVLLVIRVGRPPHAESLDAAPQSSAPEEVDEAQEALAGEASVPEDRGTLVVSPEDEAEVQEADHEGPDDAQPSPESDPQAEATTRSPRKKGAGEGASGKKKPGPKKSQGKSRSKK